jgi:glycosyltransferase involved in cell wall biosynthesis
MTLFAIVLLLSPLAFAVYAYVVYPLALRIAAVSHPAERVADPPEWPTITIVIPCYNEEHSIAAALERVLAAEYEEELREILVVSDASTDCTDAIVRAHAAHGVTLIRLPHRQGKTAAENTARRAARGEIVINIDASVRIGEHAIKPLVRAFTDPTVAVASGRDVSVGSDETRDNRGESGYVDYEMRVRALETRVGSIIGASGCFFATRRGVDELDFPLHLSRDFAAALIAREQGYRSVSVPAAVCFVPLTRALGREMRRKVRTMARGLSTLWYKRALLNPWRYGRFAVMLISHKLCRWLVYASLPPSAVGLILLSVTWPFARVVLALALIGVAFGVIGLRASRANPSPSPLAFAGFAFGSVLAGVLAWFEFLRGTRQAVWKPTDRAVG